jgi:anaerobic magnesium-protoporphyrin IX monomethyl ester cyclase
MKILFVRPPFAVEKFYFPRFIHEPLGIEYLASSVCSDHDVKTIDCVAEDWNNYWEAGKYPETIFQGLKPEKLIKKIREYNPEIIGINWLFSTQNNSVDLVASAIKEINKDITIIVGGPHPSANPEQILNENKNIDIVVYGEGEITTKEVLDNNVRNLKGINGIAYRENNRITVNPPRKLIENLDELPFPLRNRKTYENYSKQFLYEAIYSKTKSRDLSHLLSALPFANKAYYLYHNKNSGKKLPAGDIITSRGCPNHCTFCAIHNIWGHSWRMRSAQNVLKEIDILVNEFGVKHINIQDDNFNVSKERTIEICKGIVEKKYDITLLAPSGAFVPTLDEEVLTWLKRAGLNELRMSIESGNQDILYNVIKKNIDLTKVKEIIDICKKLKIETEGAFIFGIPGETIETMQQSLEFANRAGFNRIIKFIFQPFPNTELYKLCVEKHYLTKDYNPQKLYVTGNECYVKTDKFSPEDVLKIVNRKNSN